VRSLLAALIVTLAVVLAGCGSKHSSSNGESSKTAAQILLDTSAAAKGATAVHISGSGKSGGTLLSLDLSLVAGKGGQGHVASGGLGFDIIRIGGKAYFKGGAKFWENFGGKAAAQLFVGKWIEASSTKGDLASLAPLTNLTDLLKSILASPGALKKGAATTIDGQSAIALIDTSNGGTLYVATTGSPYPLEIKGKKGSTGTITFADWDQPVTLTAPKNSIDYAKLEAAGNG
jgi:hypothetical protein